MLLVVMAAALVGSHLGEPSGLPLSPSARVLVALIAGVAIGGVAALMGVAGGELLIPAIVLLYGVDIKVAGSLSLLVSLPTMLVAFARYRQDKTFRVVRVAGRFTVAMVVGCLTETASSGGTGRMSTMAFTPRGRGLCAGPRSAGGPRRTRCRCRGGWR